MVGLAPASIASGESGSIRIAGRVTGLSGLTAGVSYYVSTTAGALTSTRPTFARLVGVADSTTTLIIVPVTGVVHAHQQPQGRLTLTTAVPVTTTDVTAATTIRYTPYRGNRVWLYTGTEWVEHIFTEPSLSLAGLAADSNFDVFLSYNAGTLTLETAAWTNDTTRATALVLQDGLLVKTGATTRLYLGTIRTTGTIGQTEDSHAKRYVWNAFHRVDRPMRVLEATNSWATGSTVAMRQANSAAGNQLDVVAGLAEEAIAVDVFVNVTQSGSNETVMTAIGEDSTSAAAAGSLIASWNSIAGDRRQMAAHLRTIPAVGRHIYTWLEQTTISGGGTTTWYGDNNTPTTLQSGIVGMWRC